METFFGEIRGSVTNLITKGLQDLNSAKLQTAAWICTRSIASGGNRKQPRVNIKS